MSVLCLAGVCRPDERVERLQGTAAGEGGGDFRAEGREEQHQSEFAHCVFQAHQRTDSAP